MELKSREISSVNGVNGRTSSGLSLKVTSENSSPFTEPAKNCSTAVRESWIRLRMLPLMSKTRPVESGASDRENETISCSVSSSRTRKAFCGKPRTGRSRWSATVTGISTSFTSSRKVDRGNSSEIGCGRDRGTIETTL